MAIPTQKRKQMLEAFGERYQLIEQDEGVKSQIDKERTVENTINELKRLKKEIEDGKETHNERP